MFLEHHYQNAYVTHDIDQALEALRETHGADAFTRIELRSQVWTRDGEGVIVSRIALGWIGRLQYEVIEPVSGPVGLYREAVSADQLMRFHHVAMRVEDWPALCNDIDRKGRTVVLRGQSDGLKFLYVDARDTLGHYLEYVWATPEKWKTMGLPPGLHQG